MPMLIVGDREGTTKRLCDKEFAERSVELSGATASKLLFYWVMTGNPSNCSENDLVLFVRSFGFVSPFWLLR